MEGRWKLSRPSRPFLTGPAAGERLVRSLDPLGPVERAQFTVRNIEYSLFSPDSTAAMEFDSESVQSEDFFKQPSNPVEDVKTQPSTPQRQAGVRLHEFVSKTVSFVSALSDSA